MKFSIGPFTVNENRQSSLNGYGLTKLEINPFINSLEFCELPHMDFALHDINASSWYTTSKSSDSTHTHKNQSNLQMLFTLFFKKAK